MLGMRFAAAVFATSAMVLVGCGGDDSPNRSASGDTEAEGSDTTTSEPVTSSSMMSAPSTTTTATGRTPTTRRSGGSGGGASNTTAAPSPAPTTTAAPRPANRQAITIQNFTFSPPVLDVALGTVVTATNRDEAPHTWTADDDSWDSGDLAQNASYSHTFNSPGTFTYSCEIHASMKGTVRVA